MAVQLSSEAERIVAKSGVEWSVGEYELVLNELRAKREQVTAFAIGRLAKSGKLLYCCEEECAEMAFDKVVARFPRFVQSYGKTKEPGVGRFFALFAKEFWFRALTIQKKQVKDAARSLASLQLTTDGHSTAASQWRARSSHDEPTAALLTSAEQTKLSSVDERAKRRSVGIDSEEWKSVVLHAIDKLGAAREAFVQHYLRGSKQDHTRNVVRQHLLRGRILVKMALALNGLVDEPISFAVTPKALRQLLREIRIASTVQLASPACSGLQNERKGIEHLSFSMDKLRGDESNRKELLGRLRKYAPGWPNAQSESAEEATSIIYEKVFVPLNRSLDALCAYHRFVLLYHQLLAQTYRDIDRLDPKQRSSRIESKVACTRLKQMLRADGVSI